MLQYISARLPLSADIYRVKYIHLLDTQIWYIVSSVNLAKDHYVPPLVFVDHSLWTSESQPAVNNNNVSGHSLQYLTSECQSLV